MKSPLIVFSLIIYATTLAFGQTGNATHNQETKPGVSQMISLVPLYLAANGLRVDYDIRLNQKHWLQLGPTFYLRSKELSYDQYEDSFRHLIGAGLHVYHRFYPGGVLPGRGIYISWGGVFQNFHLTYDEFILNTEIKRYSNIRKVGGDVIIGINTPLFEPVRIDFYTGMGIRHSFLESDAQTPQKFDDVHFDYGYTGNILVIGLRLSLPF